MTASECIIGDSCDVLRGLDPQTIDALITDPPAGISFMGKDWDKDKGGRDEWIAWMTGIMLQCMRVMKPGAHGLVWAMPRTSHWTATALENAGFEVRDVVTHLFGTGFPKSLNVSKSIDKASGVEIKTIEIDRQGGGFKPSPFRTSAIECGKTLKHVPDSDFAKRWQGWGTALKPASEHWILVRKPCSEKTVAANVLKWGVGGINVDGCRVEASDQATLTTAPTGRFPANLILDEDAAEILGDFSRFFYVAKASKSDRGSENTHPTVKSTKLMEYLITLITPQGGTVLDPFMGSGSTGVAAKRLGFKFIGIEKEAEYLKIAEARINN